MGEVGRNVYSSAADPAFPQVFKDPLYPQVSSIYLKASGIS